MTSFQTPHRTSPRRGRKSILAIFSALLVVVLAACEPQLPAPTKPAPAPAPSKPKPKPTTTTTAKPKPTTTTTAKPKPTTTTTAKPTTTTTAKPTTTTAPPSAGGGGGAGGHNMVHVDESKIPTGNPAHRVSGPAIGQAGYGPKAGDGSAAFRTNCRFSHMNFDDPIVFPGQSRATHLHIYFGNTGANAQSTASSIKNSGASTCMGGTLNRSAYWAPAIIDTATGAPVISNRDRTDQDHFLQIYYKSGYEGVVPSTVQNFPAGLRMIAGTASSKGPQPSHIVSYECGETSGPAMKGPAFPNCPPGSLLIMSIAFPQCWDGKNLDSPDHKSHMAYGAGWPDKGCPASHPVPLPKITQNFRYRVPASGMSTWRLSSDMYDRSLPAGYSGHADWMNGWDAPTFQTMLNNCYSPARDCQMNLLGDGRDLR